MRLGTLNIDPLTIDGVQPDTADLVGLSMASMGQGLDTVRRHQNGRWQIEEQQIQGGVASHISQAVVA